MWEFKTLLQSINYQKDDWKQKIKYTLQACTVFKIWSNVLLKYFSMWHKDRNIQENNSIYMHKIKHEKKIEQAYPQLKIKYNLLF